MFKAGLVATVAILSSANLYAVDASLVGKWQAIERNCSKAEKSMPLETSMTIEINSDGIANAEIGEKKFNYIVRTFPQGNALALVNEESGGFRYSYSVEGDTLLLSAYTFRDNPTGCAADNFQTTVYKRQ